MEIDSEVIVNAGYRKLLFHFPFKETSGSSATDDIKGLQISPVTAELTVVPTSITIANSPFGNPDSAICGSSTAKRVTLTGATFDVDKIAVPMRVTLLGTTGNDGAYNVLTLDDVNGTWFDVNCAINVTGDSITSLVFDEDEEIVFDATNKTVQLKHGSNESSLLNSKIFPSWRQGGVSISLVVADIKGRVTAYDDTIPPYSNDQLRQVRFPTGKIGSGATISARDFGMSLSFSPKAHAIFIGSGASVLSWNVNNVDGSRDFSENYLYTDSADITTGLEKVTFLLAHDSNTGKVYCKVWKDDWELLIDDESNASDIIGNGLSGASGTVIQPNEYMGAGARTRVTGLGMYGWEGLWYKTLPDLNDLAKRAHDLWASGDLADRVQVT